MPSVTWWKKLNELKALGYKLELFKQGNELFLKVAWDKRIRAHLPSSERELEGYDFLECQVVLHREARALLPKVSAGTMES